MIFNRINKHAKSIKMDKLDALLMHSSPKTQVFFSGVLRQATHMDALPGRGRLHVLQAGHLRIAMQNQAEIEIIEPSLILFLRSRHGGLNLASEPGKEAQLVCAHVDFGHALNATLLHCVPDLFLLPLAHAPELAPMLGLLAQEAQKDNCGKKVALNHLMNYFLVLLMRRLMEGDEAKAGILAALADKRLAIAVTAMHDQPQKDWTLESLAQAAGMSRARFADHFRVTTGMTALAYLASWRIEVTKVELSKGSSLKMIAPQVGYQSAETLIRSFLRHTQMTPKEWLKSVAA
jgi:AraC-like DNA-binding protein